MVLAWRFRSFTCQSPRIFFGSVKQTVGSLMSEISEIINRLVVIMN
jgi:hypothetical protein